MNKLIAEFMGVEYDNQSYEEFRHIVPVGLHIAREYDIDCVAWAGNKRYNADSIYKSVIKFIKHHNKNKKIIK